MSIAIGEEVIYKYDTKPSRSVYTQKHFASSTLFESNSGLQMEKKNCIVFKKDVFESVLHTSVSDCTTNT